MSKKKILLFTASLGSGGAERQLCGLAIGLKQRGYDVKVLTYVDNQFYEHLLTRNSVEHLFWPQLRGKMLRPIRFRRVVAQEKPDVIITYLPSANIAACLSGRPEGCKLIVSERNTDQQHGLKEQLMYNSLYGRADYLVPNSYSQFDFLKRHFPHIKCDVVTITNYVDTSTFVPGSKHNKSDVILTVARVTPQKNVTGYIRAVKLIHEKYPHLRFCWVGACSDPGYLTECQNQLKELGLNEMMRFEEPTKEIVRCYQGADALCLPSLYEGYPNVACEAMSCGLPVLCSDVCDNATIVTESVNGFLFNPRSAESIAMAFDKYMKLDEDEYNAMGCRNRKRMIEEKSESAFIDKYVELIES